MRLLPCLLVLSGSGVWQYRPNGHWQPRRSNEPMSDGTAGCPMSGDLFRGPVGGQRRPYRQAGRRGRTRCRIACLRCRHGHILGGNNDDKSGYLVGRLVPAHLLGGDPLIEPKGSRTPAYSRQLGHAGDGSPARPYHPRATASLRLRIVDGLGRGRARCTRLSGRPHQSCMRVACATACTRRS